MPSEVHTYELCKITRSHLRYGAISSYISASLKCILPLPLCITLLQRLMLMTPLTIDSTMGKNHAFVRLTKPYKCYCKPRGAIEYVIRIIANDTNNIMWKSVLVPPIREAGKAIITLFRRVLSQCFYDLKYRNVFMI